MKEKIKVAIIISTYNQDELLKKCLRSIKNNTPHKEYKVYLVDDSGSGRIIDKLGDEFKGVSMIRNKENLGFSEANNKGMRKAMKDYNPDYVLLLNDDTLILSNDWLSKLLGIAEKNKDVGILGCKIVYPDKSMQNMGGYVRGWQIIREMDDDVKEPFEVDHVMGAFMLIKREVLAKIGLLDEVFSPYLLEDTDYCLRAKNAGFRILSVPQVSIIHYKGKSIDSKLSKERIYIRLRNDIVFSLRHFKGSYKLFRLFVFLPLFCMIKKIKDEDNYKLRNLKLREGFLSNLSLYLKAWFTIITQRRK